MNNEFDDFLVALRDPYWLAKEFTRLQKAQADELTQLANAAHSRNEQERADEMPSFGRYIEG